jgi:hypothetical protein
VSGPTVEIVASPTAVRTDERVTVEVRETAYRLTPNGPTHVTAQESATRAVVRAEIVTVQVGSESVAVVEVGVQGPPGRDGANGAGGRYEFRFDWGDATPKPLLTAPTGKLIERVAVYVVEPFDGTSPALTVGDAGDADRLMTTAQVDPAAVGAYEVSPGHQYGSDTEITLSITAGSGASAGSGLVVIEYES